jgi:hypothetical protein
MNIDQISCPLSYNTDNQYIKELTNNANAKYCPFITRKCRIRKISNDT